MSEIEDTPALRLALEEADALAIELSEKQSEIDDLKLLLDERLSFDTYQKKSKETAIYPTMVHPVIYPALGLASETGELLGKLKKVFRDQRSFLSYKHEIRSEIGDVLWYLTQICTELDLSLECLAKGNLSKLSSRAKRGTLQGDGDNR